MWITIPQNRKVANVISKNGATLCGRAKQLLLIACVKRHPVGWRARYIVSRSSKALCNALLDVSASRCKCNFLFTLWLQRGFSLNECIYFSAMGVIKIQCLLHLRFGQIVIFRDFS